MLRALALAALIALPAHAAGVTTVRPIRAQTVILPEDLAEIPDAAPGGVASIAEAVGLEARQTLYPGRPILAAHLGPPALVERNAEVRMTYRRGPLAISAEGRALDRGGVGESIRVMNLGSRQIVIGAVAPDGSIEVGQ
jgi:flagella basal body P-ring formation protein FlgA